jgi:hypothetical protein
LANRGSINSKGVVMSKAAKVVVVAAVLIAGLAALETIAAARTRSVETRDPERLAALAAMDEALARQDFGAAVQAWREARQLSLRTRGWRAPLEAADAELRLAAATGRLRESKPSTRELLLVALFRARAEGATEGALRVAESFARLGDREAAQLALRLAENVAARHGDGAEHARVRLVGEQIQRPASIKPAASTPAGS